MIVSSLIVGAVQVQPLTCPLLTSSNAVGGQEDVWASSGFHSANITPVLISPANRSRVVGIFNMTLNITSVNGPLNLTLFVQGQIYPAYNRTLIGAGLQNVTVNSTVLAEGNLNFTLLFENYNFVPPDRDSYYLVFLVDNHGSPALVFLAPAENGTFTGMDKIYLNITSDYAEVFVNVTVDGQMTNEFNATLVPVGAANYTINGTRYDNGQHVVNVTVYTKEGLKASKSRTLYFLDYVRFTITGLSTFSTVKGNQTISVKVSTPYQNVTFSAYVDDVLVPNVDNVTLLRGTSPILIDVTVYSEGRHNFTFKAYDAFGHRWVYGMELVVDNHGVPAAFFTAVTGDVVVGMASFTVRINSTWKDVNVTVYVDGVPVSGLVNVTVNVGLYTFQIDTGSYTKAQHNVTVVVITPEGLKTQVQREFGFATFRPEEIVSFVVLLGLAAAIPVIRWRQGKPVRPVIVVDIVFAIVVFALFFLLGVNTYPLVVWHFNMASIWAIGTTLVFTNWVVPIVTEESKPES
ncbi:MAG: hypothetical protein C4K49_09990 [Candidatus Thorarchaeota archaeon]|nr:MAG: hypothetical protein C4K49_09990 [Candidatus Thorarchaeota archaeon]